MQCPGSVCLCKEFGLMASWLMCNVLPDYFTAFRGVDVDVDVDHQYIAALWTLTAPVP
jgi:hypothetical protein